MTREYREVRKTYITARVEETQGGAPPRGGNWRRGWKEEACREFDEFVEDQRRIAVEEHRKKMES